MWNQCLQRYGILYLKLEMCSPWKKLKTGTPIFFLSVTQVIPLCKISLLISCIFMIWSSAYPLLFSSVLFSKYNILCIICFFTKYTLALSWTVDNSDFGGSSCLRNFLNNFKFLIFDQFEKKNQLTYSEE